MRVIYHDSYEEAYDIPPPNLNSLARLVTEEYETYEIDEKTYEVEKQPIGFVHFAR